MQLSFMMHMKYSFEIHCALNKTVSKTVYGTVLAEMTSSRKSHGPGTKIPIRLATLKEGQCFHKQDREFGDTQQLVDGNHSISILGPSLPLNNH